MQEIELQYACLCVLANKQDIEGAATAEELAKILDVGSLEAPHIVLNSTARTGDGLDEAMNWLSENIKEV